MPTLTSTVSDTQRVTGGLYLDYPEDEVPEGGLPDGQNVEPDIGVMRRAPGYSKFSTTPLPGTGPGMLFADFVTASETRNLLAATRTRLSKFNASTGVFDDLTGGVNLLTGASTNPIFWASLADLFVLTNGVDNIKKSTGSTWADLGGSPPKALGLDAYEGHILLWNTTTGGTQTAFRVQWSDLNLPESWAVASGSEAGSLDIREQNLYPILAGAKMRRSYFLYKESRGGIYALTYVGGSLVMQQELVYPKIGVFSPKGVVADGDVHYVVADDRQVYRIAAGSAPEAIGNPIRKRLFGRLNWNSRRALWTAVNTVNNQLVIASPEGADTSATRAYIMSTITGAWGERELLMGTGATVRDPRTTTIDGLTGTIDALAGPIDSLSSVGQDVFLIGGTSDSAFVHLYGGSDTAEGTIDGWIVTRWVGRGGGREMRLRAVEVDLQAGSAVIEAGTAPDLATGMSFTSLGNLTRGKVGANTSAEYVAARIRSVAGGGQFEVSGYRLDAYPRGRR